MQHPPDCCSGEPSAGPAEKHTAKCFLTASIGVGLTLGGTAHSSGNEFDSLAGFEEAEGSPFNDTLSGDANANQLFGRAGNDNLIGNDGNDTLVGGDDDDSIDGGSGIDLLTYNSALNAATNVDKLMDFTPNTDRIVLDHLVFTNLIAGALGATQLAANATGTAQDANDFITHNTTTGVLSYDADGNGSGAAAVQFATLTNLPAITAADFSVFQGRSAHGRRACRRPHQGGAVCAQQTRRGIRQSGDHMPSA